MEESQSALSSSPRSTDSSKNCPAGFFHESTTPAQTQASNNKTSSEPLHAIYLSGSGDGEDGPLTPPFSYDPRSIVPDSSAPSISSRSAAFFSRGLRFFKELHKSLTRILRPGY